jgi:hypothetical protein
MCDELKNAGQRPAQNYAQLNPPPLGAQAADESRDEQDLEKRESIFSISAQSHCGHLTPHSSAAL